MHLAHEKNIEIKQNFDLPYLPVTGDYGRLRQMFLIILDNAIKFSQDGSAIDVLLKDRVVSISDRGKGIAKEDLPHIFDRFYKVKSEENINGSGLGLAIAKQIAERHSVEVSVNSEVDAGTEFRFKF